MRTRNSSRVVVTALALAATLLALGFGMLRRGDPADDDRASSGASIGPAASPVVSRADDGRSPAAVGPSGRDASGAASQSPRIGPTLPSDGLDRNTEYVVEDGLIVPQRVVGPGAVSGGAGGEQSVPEASPTAIPTAGAEEPTVPAGIAGPVVDVHDQLVPGGNAASTRAPTNEQADAGEASAQQVPRL